MMFAFRSILAAILAATTAHSAEKTPPPFGAVPTDAQLRWQRMEYYAFVHFGLNTWTDREWGYGDEDPTLFDPDSFDARKIVRTFKDEGMEGMILTAKHHDGFCLWPSKTTSHNISKSPWMNGRGDLVREFADACRAEDMKFGIYVSPWDRNHADYAKPAYVKAFHDQIREVLTHYGPIFEIWFDGANGGDGYYGGARETRTIPDNYYDFPAIVAMTRELQPNCVVWGAGTVGDARWGGSEKGHVGYPHWHTLDSEKGGDGAHGFKHGDRWVPAEGDTSIRHGWFWHEREDSQVKSPETLLKVWFECIGRGANLILNVPPDRSGIIRQPDLDSLKGFKELRDALFSENLAQGAAATGPARGSDPRFDPASLVDGDIESFWTVDDGDTDPSAELTLPSTQKFDVIRLREHIRLGQRVEAFAIDVWSDGQWREIHRGQTIGVQRLIKLDHAYETDKLRLRITSTPAVPCISEWSLYRMPVVLSAPELKRDAQGQVVILAKGAGEIRYTLDGSEPDSNSAVFTDPIPLPMGGTVIARVTDGDRLGSLVSKQFSMSKSKWKIIATTTGEASKAIDDDPRTFWHTHIDGEKNPPQSFDVDMGESVNISAFTYLPRQDGTPHGMTDRYRIELSRDGRRWVKIAEGEFSNIRANPIEQTIKLKAPVAARYFRFTGLRAVELKHISAAEVGVIPKS